jgi:hypothetical protein
MSEGAVKSAAAVFFFLAILFLAFVVFYIVPVGLWETAKFEGRCEQMGGIRDDDLCIKGNVVIDRIK